MDNMREVLSSLPSCRHRQLLRLLKLRRRPVAFLLVGLALWLTVYMFSIHGSFASSASSRSDPQGISLYRLSMLQQQPGNHQDSNPQTGEAISSNGSERLGAESDVKDLFEEEEEEFGRRRRHYEAVCQAGLSGPVGDIQYYEQAKLALCLIPKVGSTFWMRIFHFLYHDTEGKPVTSPFDIGRYHVLFTSGRKTKVTNYFQSKTLIDSFNKVIFTRDPWSRLWSSYVDKLVLPDSWLDHGMAILGRRNDRSQTKHCPDDIKFVEFLDYVVKSNRGSHWRPVSKVCNPCIFRPHYVGKMETFTEDTNHILRLVGLQNLTEGRDSVASYTEDQVRQITDYHFRLYETRPKIQKCLSHSGLAERLWKAFVLNGYIAEDIKFPREEFKVADQTTDAINAGLKTTKLLVDYHKRSPARTARQLREYRKSVMAHHYRKAPKDLLEMIADVFSGDFALFDYDSRPTDIFVPFADDINITYDNRSETR